MALNREVRLTKSRMQIKKETFRRDIEGLRAVAVLLVIVYHSKLFPCRGGFVGVDVFFVLSGYLITGILLQELFKSEGIKLWDFYARRVRRLLPASTAMLVCTLFAAYLILPPFEQASVAASVRANFAYISNIFFARWTSDYFGTNVSNAPLLHTWSLAVEEQFYFVWPLMILAVYRLCRSRSSLYILFSAIFLFSLTTSIWLTSANQPFAFFLMPPRAWEFAVGGLASQMALSRQHCTNVLRFMGWLGLVTVIASGFLMSSAGFPGLKAILPVIATAAVLISGIPADRLSAGALLKTPVLEYVGSRSYALYLWHWPILSFASDLKDPLTAQVRVLCVAVTFAFAELTQRFIENPVRFNPYLQSHGRVCVGASIIIILLGVGGGSVYRFRAVHTASFAAYERIAGDIPEDFKMGCEVGGGDSAPRECDFGSKRPRTTVVLFGDSHMEQWLPAFQAIAGKKNWKVVLFVKSHCPALAIPISSGQASGEDHWCRDWRTQAIRKIHELKPTAVILSNATDYTAVDNPEVRQSTGAWRAGARDTFSALKEDGLPLIFLRDTPWAGYDVTQCLSRFSWNKRRPCPALARTTALDNNVYQAQKMGASDVARPAFVDMSDSICGTSECPLTKNQTFVYRDSNHLTSTFLRGLSDDLYIQLVSAVPVLAL